MGSVEAYLPVMVALAGGVFSAPVWSFFSRKLGFDQTEMDRMRRGHRECEERLRDVQQRLALIEAHHASYFARWIRDVHKRVLWVNDKAMLTIFAPLGYNREDVYGKTFSDLLDPLAAKEIDQLDQAALASPGSPASAPIKLHPDLPLKIVVKVAGSGRDGDLIYEGIAFRPNDREIITGFGIGRNAAQRALSLDNLSADQIADK
jgi:hypothetical protein